MTSGEIADIKRLNEECDAIRKTAFSAMRMALRMSPTEIKNSGYLTAEAAAIGHFLFQDKKIRALHAAHIRKWPD